MEPGSIHLRYGAVWLFAIFFFFFNSFLLPLGLTYALLLAPLWLYVVYKEKQTSLALTMMVPIILYAAIHLLQGVVLQYYLISVTMICGVIFFVIGTYCYINKTGVDWDIIFKDIAVLNFILAIACIPLLYINSLKPLVWYLIPITEKIGIIPRLKLFTPEASHYSFLLAPPAIYFFSRAIFFKSQNSFMTLFMITVPLLMSFSLGVLSCLTFTGILIIIFFAKRIFCSKRQIRGVISFISTGVLVLVAAYFLYPNNPLFFRIHNIFTGDDTSARGRTYEAFILANKIIAHKSYWWGIGPGQLKILGRKIVIVYYFYNKVPETIRIPNACAETIVYFGYVGFGMRMAAEVFLFFKTKVFKNPFRLWLFLFVFIYQFTGSYITNIQEYIIWILAFSPLLPEFIRSKNGTLLNEDGS